MDQQPSGREDYVRKVLEAYRNTPGTCGHLRRPDRMLAVQLYQRGVPLIEIENALVLAAVRRMIRPADAPPLDYRALSGLLHASYRGSNRDGSRGRVLPIRTAKTPEATPILKVHAERMPQPRLRRGMTLKSKTPPHLRCGMMLYISLPRQILFLPWLPSAKHKWLILR